MLVPEQIKLSLTAAKLIVGMKGKKFYTVPKAITLMKMNDAFVLGDDKDSMGRGNAGDFLASNGEKIWIIPAAEVAANYRPARSPKKGKAVPTVDK